MTPERDGNTKAVGPEAESNAKSVVAGLPNFRSVPTGDSVYCRLALGVGEVGVSYRVGKLLFAYESCLLTVIVSGPAGLNARAVSGSVTVI